jgi:tetratricopeptide (TPR) repeat protein
MDDLTAANLSKQARAAAMAGEREEAVALLRQALEIQADDANNLKSLAALTDDNDEKRRALEHIIALDPFDDEAKTALAHLDGVEGYGAPPAEEVLYCANHPDRETMLRCNKCNKPICMECAVQTPVGYRCKQCVRQQQDKFYTASLSDKSKGYIAAAVSGVLLGVGAILMGMFLGGFFGIILAIFVGPAIGGGLGELTWRATGRKRSRNFNLYTTAIATVIAALMVLAVLQLSLTGFITVGLAASAMYARLRFAS